ncbi:MAG: beta-phosphoglucomutase [Culicoidibacterales bacterium]
MTKYQSVVFDLDGVITDTAHYHFLAWRNLANKLGIAFDEAFNEELKGISRMESLEKILVKGGVAEKYTAEEKAVLADQKNVEYVALLADMSPSDIFPGIETLLTQLRAQGTKIALASASKNAPMILDALGITTLFDYVVDPDEVPNGKPAPDIFVRGAEAVGADPKFSIGVEDAVAGIRGVLDAGMFAVGVGTPEQMEQAGAHLVVQDTNDLTVALLNAKYQK